MKWKDKLFDIVIALAILVLIWMLTGFTTLASFHIPSSSMEPTLLPGDNILVNKWTVGGRWISGKGDSMNITRLPALGKIKRNDILVFNYLYPKSKDSIGFCRNKYFVKRCLALPGDTFFIKHAMYGVNGCNEPIGIVEEQRKLSRLLEDTVLVERMDLKTKSYPRRDTLLGWDIENFGPMWIPKKGSRIILDPYNEQLYRIPIEWELGKKLKDTLVHEYTFKHDYYFMGGDHCIDSQDSRYWGVVPDDFIVGSVFLIWKSSDPITGKMRWERVFKEVK